MTSRIEAVYEGGFFRPTEKVALTEGTRVTVLVPQSARPRDPKVVAARLAQIAGQPSRGEEPETTSVDHDRILYGGESQP